MKVINIRFRFGNTPRVANVYYSPEDCTGTIYFTDVELILTFGNKAHYNRHHGIVFLKKGTNAEGLANAIHGQLENLRLAA